MQYRMLGKTGMKVSVIGLGCEGFAGKDQTFTNGLLDRARAAGVNCLDIYTSDPELRTRPGRMQIVFEDLPFGVKMMENMQPANRLFGK